MSGTYALPSIDVFRGERARESCKQAKRLSRDSPTLSPTIHAFLVSTKMFQHGDLSSRRAQPVRLQSIGPRPPHPTFTTMKTSKEAQSSVKSISKPPLRISQTLLPTVQAKSKSKMELKTSQQTICSIQTFQDRLTDRLRRR
jgi:hypothetical protein